MKPKIISTLPERFFNRFEKALLKELQEEISSGYEYEPYELEEKINEFLQNHQYRYPRCDRKKILVLLGKTDETITLRVGKNAENGQKIFVLITIIFTKN